MEDGNTAKIVRRGFVPSDERDFSGKSLEKLRCAAEEVCFLLNRGYAVKNSTTFVGNHHQLSERQRLALARTLSSDEKIALRRAKELKSADLKGKTVYIDGFNTIITLEIALSSSTLFYGMDGTIRDLAGLRGTYSIIDKTVPAVRAIAKELTSLKIERAVFYLDAPVSNSRRLMGLILDTMRGCPFKTEVYVENAVDPILSALENVVTSDAVILDECMSFFNLNAHIIGRMGCPVIKIL